MQAKRISNLLDYICKKKKKTVNATRCNSDIREQKFWKAHNNENNQSIKTISELHREATFYIKYVAH